MKIWGREKNKGTFVKKSLFSGADRVFADVSGVFGRYFHYGTKYECDHRGCIYGHGLCGALTGR